MDASREVDVFGGWTNRLWPALLPELQRFAPDERAAALNAARETEFDIVELLGMAAALVLVASVTRYAIGDSDVATRLAAALLNFVVALPLLLVAAGPFHLRRLRRGLRDQLQRRQAPWMNKGARS